MSVESNPVGNPGNNSGIQILPYSQIVGQAQIKLALEIAYIAPPRLGGVLISGQRGTGKSTAVRAFARMIYDRLPVTLPINATEDRVVGGWQIDKLMASKTEWQDGLLQAANGQLLYVDEVNLLDDHIVNIILDVTSTGVLVVQRDGNDRQAESVAFTLVGTMNPEEGGLRPQLLDRFGLMVSVAAESDRAQRVRILQNVLKFDEERSQPKSAWLDKARAENEARRVKLVGAKKQFDRVEVSEETISTCIELCDRFQAQGNRGDYVLTMAARAYAALEGMDTVTNECLRVVAPLALQHRRQEMGQIVWNEGDDLAVAEVLGL
jgi:magnesium chelatase subunit I